MITATRIPVGKSLTDGSEVFISPENGPLLIFGSSGSGKTVVAKKLIKRTAEGGLGPIFVYDHSAATRYGELVRVLNASGPRRGAEVIEHIQLLVDDAPIGQGRGSVVVSDGLGWRGRVMRTPGATRDRRLHEVLARRVGSGGPPPHFFTDGLDYFVDTSSSAEALVGRVWGSSRSLGTLAVGAVLDATAFLAREEGLFLARSSGSVLILNMFEKDATALLDELGPLLAGGEHLDPRRMWRQPAGHGVLYEGASRTATGVRIDLSDGELALFNTDPSARRLAW